MRCNSFKGFCLGLGLGLGVGFRVYSLASNFLVFPHCKKWSVLSTPNLVCKLSQVARLLMYVRTWEHHLVCVLHQKVCWTHFQMCCAHQYFDTPLVCHGLVCWAHFIFYSAKVSDYICTNYYFTLWLMPAKNVDGHIQDRTVCILKEVKPRPPECLINNWYINPFLPQFWLQLICHKGTF